MLEFLNSGMSIDVLLADYEDLEREDVLAALAIAARLSQVKRIEATRTLSRIAELAVALAAAVYLA
jgi:hypothetical protein